MCLITYAPQGSASLDWDVLDYSREYMNSDGYGLAWYQDGRWHTRKSLDSNGLEKAISRIPRKFPLVVHQRFSTHGAVSKANLHPFPIGDTGAILFHNGTISGTAADSRGGMLKPKTGVKAPDPAAPNDTRCYIRDELAPLLDTVGANFLYTAGVAKSIGARVKGSVLVICLEGDPEPVIINEYQGDWVDGLYYSNSYSRPPPERPWPAPFALYGAELDERFDAALLEDAKDFCILDDDDDDEVEGGASEEDDGSWSKGLHYRPLRAY